MDVFLSHGSQTAVLLVGKPVLSTSVETEKSQVKHQGNVCDLFDCEDIIDQECVPPGQTLKQLYHQEVLQHLSK